MPDHATYSPYPDSRTCHVGTYRRVLPVSVERMYENALDWEHLPYVHAGSFKAIEPIDAGPWGWRAEIISARGEGSIIESGSGVSSLDHANAGRSQRRQ